jgi:hypothetical protein
MQLTYTLAAATHLLLLQLPIRQGPVAHSADHTHKALKRPRVAYEVTEADIENAEPSTEAAAAAATSASFGSDTQSTTTAAVGATACAQNSLGSILAACLAQRAQGDERAQVYCYASSMCALSTVLLVSSALSLQALRFALEVMSQST